MFCTHCGNEAGEDAVYCQRCGRETGSGRARRSSGDYAPKRLFRLTYDKKIAGICAGIARYLDVDVTLVRILTVAVTCVSGFLPGAIAYLIAWMIMPVDKGETQVAHQMPAATAG